MIIIPPELLPYSADRYYIDIEYREQSDIEARAERQKRLALLFNPDLEDIIDY